MNKAAGGERRTEKIEALHDAVRELWDGVYPEDVFPWPPEADNPDTPARLYARVRHCLRAIHGEPSRESEGELIGWATRDAPESQTWALWTTDDPPPDDADFYERIDVRRVPESGREESDNE